MNSLEVEFLFMLNFDLFVTTEVYKQYYDELWSHAKMQSLACACYEAKVPSLLLPQTDAQHQTTQNNQQQQQHHHHQHQRNQNQTRTQTQNQTQRSREGPVQCSRQLAIPPRVVGGGVSHSLVKGF